jgi:CRISPR-associated endonuclease/helicase Cas3
LAAIHDVGKMSPAFAVQVPILADRMRAHGLVASPAFAQDPVRSQVTHALVGYRTVRDWLTTELGFARRGAATQLAGIVGSHHGLPPEDGQLSLIGDRPDLAGTGTWAQTRSELLDRAAAAIGGNAALERYRGIRLSRPSQVLLTGIVIVADWIASNADLFPLQPISTADEPIADIDEHVRSAETAKRLNKGLSELDLPKGWSAQHLPGDLDQAFRDRFNADAAGARPVQVAAVTAAKAQTTPGMIIVEAPMGSGKTEAALLAAEEFAAATGADGCFVALPTQATTDAMFSRVTRWLEALPGLDRAAATSVYLAHGKAVLNDQFGGLMRDGRFGSIGDTDGGWLVAHQWLTGRKKGVLASFVVGTIDQVLFAGLKSRHLMLRHLALAGKVVIIDEVHAYDVYMSQYLHRVLHWLSAYGVPVVLLSATLPAAQRAELLRAYDSVTASRTTYEAAGDVGYPVVMSSGGLPPRAVTMPGTTTTVRLDHPGDDLDALVVYLRRHLHAGGCAVVVRNTVTRVQDTAERLLAEFGEEHVTVNHARFLSCDRARTDRGLLRHFGPPESTTRRPDLHVVVASQVVEQSLDIDFDLLVTDLAPVDLILQRMGRLHRHHRTRPAPVRDARCAVVGVPDWTAEPPYSTAGSRRVYGDHTLLRAAAMLGPGTRKDVVLPTDISPLVQAAYGGEPLGSDSWQPSMAKAGEKAAALARKRTENAQHFLLGTVPPDTGSLIGWVRAGVGDTDDDPRGAAQVRDGEESLEVLVVQRDTDGGLLTPPWIASGGDMPIPLDQAVDTSQARVIAACSLRLPLALCHPGVIDDVITALEANNFTSFHQTPLLRGQLVLVLDTDRTALVRHGGTHFQLIYDLQRGLLHERR